MIMFIITMLISNIYLSTFWFPFIILKPLNAPFIIKYTNEAFDIREIREFIGFWVMVLISIWSSMTLSKIINIKFHNRDRNDK